MKNKVFLSIETSMNRIFLVVYNMQTLFAVHKNVQSSIEIDLNNLLNKTLKKAKINFDNLDFILVSLGPGSFTGIRVGLSAAKAISLSLRKNLYGYSNFKAMLYQAIIEKKIPVNKKINLLIKSSKYDFYCQRFCEGKFEKISVKNIDRLKKHHNEENFYLGNFKNIYDLENFQICIPSKDSILKIVQANDLHKGDYLYKALNPFYIKEHYAKNSSEKK